MTSKPTPVYHVARTASAAKKFAESHMPNVVGSSERTEGGYTPVALLRSDQEWLVARLEERGVKCVVDQSGARMVSDEMIRAGAAVVKDRVQPHCGDGFALDLAERVYRAMESVR